MTRLAWLAVVPVAALALAGCGGTGSPAAAPASHAPSAAATTATPLTCKQQSDAWKQQTLAILTNFKNALIPFESGTVTSAQAHALSSTAQAAANAPPPACADPKGYYTQALANLVTAGSAASGGGALAELGAVTPLENALTLLTELSSELHQTIGSGKL